MGHRLTNRDEHALTATCSACGPDAAIARNGRQGWVCREGRREARRRYRAAHPERAKAAAKGKSRHRLERRDGSPDVCRLCGPVTPVPMGRGWGCPKRASELGWKVFAEAPQPACLVCRTWLDRFGSCAKCDAEADVDGLFIPDESRLRSRGRADVSDWLLNGYTVSEGEPPLSDGNESVVPGWKTLGSFEPVGSRPAVRPEYAKLYGSGKR